MDQILYCYKLILVFTGGNCWNDVVRVASLLRLARIKLQYYTAKIYHPNVEREHH